MVPFPSTRRALGAAVPATTALLAGVTADAQIIVTDAGNTTISVTSQQIFFQLGDGIGGTGTVSSSGLSGTHYSLQYSSSNLQKPSVYTSDGASVADANGYATNFAPGSSVDGTHAFTMGPATVWLNENDSNPAWAAGTRGYVGLRQVSVDTDSGYLYAWADVTYGSDSSLTLHRFAYEQSGSPIAAGAIPEPSTYAALAGLLAGSAALYHRRRNRKNESA